MKTAFAIGAHPDDIEFFMAGTLILLRDAGYAIHYMTLANGCCGTTQYDRQTIAAMRRAEAAKAAASINATFHDSLCNDLEIFYDLPTLKKLSAVMREVAPDIDEIMMVRKAPAVGSAGPVQGVPAAPAIKPVR